LLPERGGMRTSIAVALAAAIAIIVAGPPGAWASAGGVDQYRVACHGVSEGLRVRLGRSA
jgi:hypothetical protein